MAKVHSTAHTPDINELARQAGRIASAIHPPDTMGGHDETGGYVTSLTEAVMGVTKALTLIANSNHDIADGLREIAVSIKRSGKEGGGK